MKILFLSKYPTAHIGGVERHVRAVGDRLQVKGYRVTTVSEEQIKPPHKKLIGLLHIWYWLFKNRKLIIDSDIVHIHDVFIWYLPFRVLFPKKKVYITFHGWEGKFPPTAWSIFNKRIANKLTNGSIAAGKYIEKWYGITASHIIYGGIDSRFKISDLRKTKNTIVWLGRQDEDTGINEFKEWLSKQKINYKVIYVTNVTNPEKYLKTAEYCVPSGYLSYLEAKSYGCKIITFANNPLKVDYWNEIKLLKILPTWDDVADIYLKLWKL